eukprot:GHVQ01013282.1.p2 GENE.GHVQ01013282.1~~GHVQ01013282.1.p2  ORF type:complete len:160 (+),score=2.07 GHVQ01013282.1:546-1025(+)
MRKNHPSLFVVTVRHMFLFCVFRSPELDEFRRRSPSRSRSRSWRRGGNRRGSRSPSDKGFNRRRSGSDSGRERPIRSRSPPVVQEPALRDGSRSGEFREGSPPREHVAASREGSQSPSRMSNNGERVQGSPKRSGSRSPSESRRDRAGRESVSDPSEQE